MFNTRIWVKMFFGATGVQMGAFGDCFGTLCTAGTVMFYLTSGAAGTVRLSDIRRRRHGTAFWHWAPQARYGLSTLSAAGTIWFSGHWTPQARYDFWDNERRRHGTLHGCMAAWLNHCFTVFPTSCITIASIPQFLGSINHQYFYFRPVNRIFQTGGIQYFRPVNIVF